MLFQHACGTVVALGHLGVPVALGRIERICETVHERWELHSGLRFIVRIASIVKIPQTQHAP